GSEIREHVERQSERVALVHVLVIAPMPAHREAVAMGEPAHVDIALGKQAQIVGAKISADRADDTDRRKKARGEREIAGRAAQYIIGPVLLRLDGVVGDRTNHHDTHSSESAEPCLIALLALLNKACFGSLQIFAD